MPNRKTQSSSAPLRHLDHLDVPEVPGLGKKRQRRATKFPLAGGDGKKTNASSEQACLCGAMCPMGKLLQRKGALVCRGNPECPAAGNRRAGCPLEKMKIAVVGGAEKTAPEYRCVVQELGGECLYHDGCTGSGADRLRRVIGRADVVVCITSINSHGAMKMAKTFCKRKGKRLLVTREAGACSLRKMLLHMAV